MDAKSTFPAVCMLVTLGTSALVADEGMWLLTNPPESVLQSRYGFKPTPEWLEHVQKSAVQIGASGSFVSPEGLIFTNHHVGARQIFKLSTAERNLMEEGFYARTRGEELKCPDMEIRVLWSIEDVSARIDGAVTAAMSAAEAYTARRKEMTRVEQESKDSTGLESEVVTLYHGARYHLYRYKSYKDVRLVMAPEKSIAFFGGDTDNFEYPRYALDCCFFRAYENNRPVQVEHFLKWSRAGARDGELTFVVGHPGRTRRLYTAEHLEFLRDIDVPCTLRSLWRREVQLQTFCNRGPENARVGQDQLFGVQNSRKALTGALAGLLEPELFQRKRDAQVRLQEAAAAAEATSRADGPWSRIADAQQVRREFHVRHQLLGRVYGTNLFWIARHLVRLGDELPKPSPERLREYRDSELDSLYHSLYSPAPIYESLEINAVASWLSNMAEMLGAEDPLVVMALAGVSPQARAEQVVRGSSLADVETRKRYVREGAAAIAGSTDAMIRLARLLDAQSRELRKRQEDEVDSVEREAYAEIGAARFAAYGESVYPDATGTLRLAFGAVRGYSEDGKTIPPFTNYAGLYDRWQERKGQPGFELTVRWVEARDQLDLNTPLNFVCTADIIGGNSGSPVINRDGEVVGVIFDGNLQTLIWDIAYNDDQARAVAVDCRGIIEALRKVYNADPLADELLGEQ